MQTSSKAVLVEVRENLDPSALSELRLLAEAAGYDVLKEFEQTRIVDSAYCLGRGRAEEIAKELLELKPSKVIFNNKLKPSQKYNLTHMFKLEVIDRFQLILEIFTKRAGTIEAKYQIELAKLQYELPMAKENVRLAKQGELPGFHGLGKYQVDVYSTMIKRRISYIKRRLKEISTQKSIHRQSRRKDALFTIALTGYTFAGKTTLFNLLTKENLPIGSNLFTTLSTTTRAVSVNTRKTLFSDTVGFIDNLPHMLVDAFYSTLEEMTLADLVLLILDSSDQLYEFTRKLDTCISTLNSIGVFRNAIVPVLNKVEMAGELKPHREEVERLLGTKPIEISAKTGEGIPKLMDLIATRLPKYESFRLRIPATNNIGSLVSWAFEETDVKTIKYSETIVEMDIQMLPSYLPKFKQLMNGIKGAEVQNLTEAKVRKE